LPAVQNQRVKKLKLILTISEKINIRNEEFWNVLTHGVGAIMSVIGLMLMIDNAAQNGSAFEIFCVTVFGLSLVMLYTASSLYHYTSDKRKKILLRRIDHLCIYLLIAGTYTPVMLLGIKGIWGWVVFSAIWVLAFIGFVFKLSPYWKKEKISLFIYLLMGWLAIIAIKPIVETLSLSALIYIGLGGLAYTGGVFFYSNRKIPFNHAIWHVFVMGGSFFHFLAVFMHIL